MKQMMNEVNPKAGTLKQTNGKTLQNVSRKLIAFVLMLAITLQPAMVNAATNDDHGDTCCSVEKKKVNRFANLAKLTLPSAKLINKADSEITSALYKSINENKVKQYAEAFAAGDTEINNAFKAETSISLPNGLLADEAMIAGFLAEHIAFNSNTAAGDAEITKLFNAAHRIQFSTDALAGDEWMNIRFRAENITMPDAAMYAQADAEISGELQLNYSASTLAVK